MLPGLLRLYLLLYYQMLCGIKYNVIYTVSTKKYKYIMCLQMKFYATIEPYIYIIILPIMREEIGGLVPKIMFEFWIRHDAHN